MVTTLPVLLPANTSSFSQPSPFEWTPKKYKTASQPPPIDDGRDLEMANAKLALDGKMIKKTRPRRTVDYNGGLGRWAIHRKMKPNASYVPYLRPSPPYIIDLLPPKAYPDNPSTSLCTKFVHTSTNKLRCPVKVVTWTPEARRVLTGSQSGEFTLWNGLTFNFETILQAHDTAISAMRFNHSGSFLASADKSGVIKYFEPNMNNLTQFQGSNSREGIGGISWSPDDRRFATASDDSSVRVWSFEEGRVESVLAGHGWDVKCVEWHPAKGLLVSGSKDNQIKFWDPRTGTTLSTLHYHKNTISALAWSPNGNMLASASRDQTCRVFDIRAMKEFSVLKGHKKEVNSVTWHPIHPIVVSGGSEGSILHWDLASTSESASSLSQTPVTAPRATLSQAHDSNVWSLTFHPLGHILVTASNDHTTRFWSRERPGDSTSVFSGGGEKPPEVEGGGQDDDDDNMVPGFGMGGNGPPVGNWWGKEEDGPEGDIPGFGTGMVGIANGPGSGPGPSGYEDRKPEGGFGNNPPAPAPMDDFPGFGSGGFSGGAGFSGGPGGGSTGGGGGRNDREIDYSLGGQSDGPSNAGGHGYNDNYNHNQGGQGNWGNEGRGGGGGDGRGGGGGGGGGRRRQGGGGRWGGRDRDRGGRY